MLRLDRIGMTLRPARAADIPMLQALARAIWQEHYPAIISQAQIEFMLGEMYSTQRIEQELAAGVSWEIAEESGTAIGFLSTEVVDGEMKLSKLYLDSSRHGKGYGRTLLEHVERKARAAGAKSIYLFVNRNNAKAVRAYLRAGYEIVQELDQPFGAFVLNDYKMVKAVAVK